MQIVSNGDTLYEMSKPFFSGKNKKNIISYFSKKTGFGNFMQIVSSGDNLRKMPKSVIREK